MRLEKAATERIGHLQRHKVRQRLVEWYTHCTCSECIGTCSLVRDSECTVLYPQVSTYTHTLYTHAHTHTHTHTGCVPVPSVQSAVPAVGECPLVSPGPGQQGAQGTGRETPGPPPEADSLHIQHCHCGGLAGEGGEDETLWFILRSN